MEQKLFLYIFLDEGGNLDFSISGTKYYLMTSLSKTRPFHAYRELCELKYDLIEKNVNMEYFHASEDRQLVRNSVFNIINKYLDETRLDSLIIEKRKAMPALTVVERFYPEMLGHLIEHVISGYNLDNYEKIIIFTDSLPVERKRKAVEKAIKKVLIKRLPKEVKYSIYHHESKSNFDLQIVDYCNWAIYRKWESVDERSYEVVRRVIKSENDIFKTENKVYY